MTLVCQNNKPLAAREASGSKTEIKRQYAARNQGGRTGFILETVDIYGICFYN